MTSGFLKRRRRYFPPNYKNATILIPLYIYFHQIPFIDIFYAPNLLLFHMILSQLSRDFSSLVIIKFSLFFINFQLQITLLCIRFTSTVNIFAHKIILYFINNQGLLQLLNTKSFHLILLLLFSSWGFYTIYHMANISRIDLLIYFVRDLN